MYVTLVSARRRSLWLLYAVLLLVMPAIVLAQVSIIAKADFEDGRVPSGWTFGAQNGASARVVADTSLPFGGSNYSLKASYPTATGGQYVWFGKNIADLNTYDIAFDFWAKLPGDVKQGLKFVKIFGQSADGYANTTFGLDYTGIDNGSLYSVSFGDGTTKFNDTQKILRLDGREPTLIGRSFGLANVQTPQNTYWSASQWGSSWHHFRLRVKFNSGDTAESEVADGLIFVQIDDKVYVDAKGIFNRHYTNLPVRAFEFMGWSQSGTAPFDIYIDNLIITSGGFLSQPAFQSVTKAVH